ncbi:hypothetical protein E2P81_ATG04157 [Venturia nashicola]|uniref:Cell wall protein n=1 Tax=Venturia nashicola TaxID=86259 RepID=A0A4Z1PHP6_9PEZI|nr:hypothetical protein E6O75_ATG04256 [Venturia nashicola]TLD37345.1 hypothetical protein E2P81_ATG04157 [Venturia nashicola]
MQFTLPILACFASISLAVPIATPNELATRDAIIIDRAISRAHVALNNLVKSIDGYYFAPSRHAVSQQRLISDDSQVAVDALTQGAQQISAGPPVDRLEKAGVVLRAKDLLDLLRKTSDSWVRAKSVIVSSGGRQTIGQAVKKQANAANTFAAALVHKMPGGEAEGLATWYELEVNQAVYKSVVAFN